MKDQEITLIHKITLQHSSVKKFRKNEGIVEVSSFFLVSLNIFIFIHRIKIISQKTWYTQSICNFSKFIQFFPLVCFIVSFHYFFCLFIYKYHQKAIFFKYFFSSLNCSFLVYINIFIVGSKLNCSVFVVVVVVFLSRRNNNHSTVHSGPQKKICEQVTKFNMNNLLWNDIVVVFNYYYNKVSCLCLCFL